MIKTLKLGGYAVLASVIASPVLGEAQGDDPIELWDGLTTATTKAEVKAYRASLPSITSSALVTSGLSKRFILVVFVQLFL